MYKEVCFVQFMLGGLGASFPRKFRPSEITSGVFSSKFYTAYCAVLYYVEFAFNTLC